VSAHATTQRAAPGMTAGPSTEPLAVVSLLDATPRAATPPEPASAERSSSPRRSAGWGLVAVMLAQVALSVRLVWANTAFQDEALYLRTGHLEWAHWLHGAPIPDFPTYFSGAPVLYPPIGAVADSLGGLAAARILSLLFMLAVTMLLWAATVRLFGRRAALLATGLFATLAGTQFLGALATYDAMALALLALAVWLGVRAADCAPGARTALLIAAAATLAAADAVKYATALFTPVVVVVVALAVWRRHRPGSAVAAAAIMASAWLALVAAAVVVAGSQYWQGVTSTTLDRPASDVAVGIILQRAYIWTSLVLVLAVLGALLAFRGTERARLLPAVLAAAALLAPAEQARLHTTVSLQKHVVFGAWFAAIAAGYALARLSRVDPGRGWAPVMALPIAASTLFGSIGQADALYQAWPHSAPVIKALTSYARAYPGHYLAEDYDVEAYYLRQEVPWPRWSSTYYFAYPGASPGANAYAAAISAHYFTLIILDFGDTAATDQGIVTDMARAGGYIMLDRAGAYTIWASEKTLPSSVSKRGRRT
jgi:Dolichyl-phosphate-mannose-protein mannosyltransferase